MIFSLARWLFDRTGSDRGAAGAIRANDTRSSSLHGVAAPRVPAGVLDLEVTIGDLVESDLGRVQALRHARRGGVPLGLRQRVLVLRSALPVLQGGVDLLVHVLEFGL